WWTKRLTSPVCNPLLRVSYKRFTPVTGVEAFSDYLIKVLEELNKVMSALSDEEEEDATLKVGDKNENLDKGFNRIGIRRGRMKFEYNDGIWTAPVPPKLKDSPPCAISRSLCNDHFPTY
ncbi:hypothetical protein VPJ68_14230, partial [Parabacteroides distasonis]